MVVKPYKMLVIGLLFLLAFLQYKLWFESGGIIDMLQLKKQLALQMEDNMKRKERNNNLLHQIQPLETNDDAIESRARQELGMIKKDETFYQILNK